MQEEIRTILIGSISPHPMEPVSRLRDTTDLQRSQTMVGAIIRRPIVVHGENGYICISGNRTVVAAKQRGEKEIEVSIRMLDDEEQLKYLIQSNIQRPWTKLEKAQLSKAMIEQMEEEAGDDVRAKRAVRRRVAEIFGISRTELHGLERLSQAPQEIQAAVDRAERGQNSKVNWSKFKSKYSGLSYEEMLAKWASETGGGPREKSRQKPDKYDIQNSLQAINDAKNAISMLLSSAREASPGDLALLSEGAGPLIQLMYRVQEFLGGE